MWNNSSFGDGNASASGGGLSNSVAVADSCSSTAKGRPKLRSVVPLCVRQIRDHPEKEFTLFGMHVNIACIVGILKEFVVSSRIVAYKIQDHTGVIKAVKWLNNAASNLPTVQEGGYVKVFGTIRCEGNQKILIVLNITNVDNMNMITTHLLEVIHTRLEAENMSKNAGCTPKIEVNNPSAAVSKSTSSVPDNKVHVDDSEMAGFTPLQEKIYRHLLPINTTIGLHRGTIKLQFPAHQHGDVDAALEFLHVEGLVYTTINNDYFKATYSK